MLSIEQNGSVAVESQIKKCMRREARKKRQREKKKTLKTYSATLATENRSAHGRRRLVPFNIVQTR